MNEKQVLRTFLLFLFMVVVLSLASAANAAVTVTPRVSGYFQEGPGGGYWGSPQNVFNAASRLYDTVGEVNIGGKALTVPAKIPLVANAGTLVKTAIRLNPAGIVGTLAAGWLLDKAIHWNDATKQWEKTNTEYTQWGDTYGYISPKEDGDGSCDTSLAEPPTFCTVNDGFINNAVTVNGSCSYKCLKTGIKPVVVPVQVTQPEWDALPDPIPTVGSELPHVGYMPKGAPVDAPKYDFSPYSVPSGEPYKKPDGSTVQPMVTISSNNTNITYNTWNQTIINNLGEPVVDAPPIDENKDETKDPCDTNPDRLGCAKLDEATAEAMPSETRDIEMISPVSVGGAGQCPAPLTASFLGQAVEFSFDPLCTYADALRPVVLVLAWLSSGLIFIGGVRS